MRVLITRPLDDAEVTAQILRARGHEPVIAPLLKIMHREGVDISPEAEAILATSANGVRALAKSTPRRDFRIFAVGAQTAEAAKTQGFADVLNADGDAHDLARLVIGSRLSKSGFLLHAAGAQTRGDIAAALQREGFSVRTVTLYDAIAAEQIAADLATVEAALFYSPRSAAIFAQLARHADCGNLVACCISAAAAEALRPLGLREVRIATRPNQEILLALLR